ncbi:OmpA family protein [Campylobacter vulpis]|uniref:Membrane protein n=1 Tax=Campylobacter vulpis TaxID=1655500 RepID=A0A2G4R4V2_9BACT|nr:OmpA family protein [Campylobacter vulpis]MBS4235051.1 OmpA family protein [Campylobacter vulpis]MBS4240237.1 OmpA family protein [Campylobacter vulpis]MBS4252174.1 OmpA family protein [Campylobacter vulpis]MBS4268917.1 OmpA family protein [Campylobacter vulpis]MBS4275089.1 OmpA family protein [Campylobacter vulpis]
MKNNKEEGNFWIAYADLMAGLLFIFILLIGAIVVKYVLTQSDLRAIKENLNTQEANLELSKQALKDKESIVFQLSKELNSTATSLSLIHSQKTELENNISALSKNLKNNIDEKDRQILILLNQIELKEKELKAVQQDFKEAKEKVENLSFIRENLSKELQKKLDENISIDQKTGAISLPAEVLFDKDSFILKDEAKMSLKKILSGYLTGILDDENISKNIENIIIEGHTDSDGSYIYNLDLSQKRAYEVMSFIYSFYKDERLQKLLMASGRSFSVPILKNGVEDKDLSRRIEIKFSLKNDIALEELENFFEFR